MSLRSFPKTPAFLVAGAVAGIIGIAALTNGSGVIAGETAVIIPAPKVDQSMMATVGLETAVLAGGCFWGVQAVFQHTEGVEIAVSGYAGGQQANPSYQQVSSGNTGHAEAVEIRFDPKKISYGKILQIFFSVAHDPTQLNRQGPDHGTQYRSAIFTTSEQQQKIAAAYVAQLDAAKVYPEPIVTELAPLKAFYPAEDYHQDYATLYPEQPYIVFNDTPKIKAMEATFPELWREQPKLVFAANGT